MNKYRAKRVTVDGINFASIKESNRYLTLKMLGRSGKIKSLELQPSYDLLVKDGVHIKTPTGRNMKYLADFRYVENGKTVIEDVKGYDTKVSAIKRAVVEAYYDIKINII